MQKIILLILSGIICAAQVVAQPMSSETTESCQEVLPDNNLGIDPAALAVLQAVQKVGHITFHSPAGALNVTVDVSSTGQLTGDLREDGNQIFAAGLAPAYPIDRVSTDFAIPGLTPIAAWSPGMSFAIIVTPNPAAPGYILQLWALVPSGNARLQDWVTLAPAH